MTSKDSDTIKEGLYHLSLIKHSIGEWAEAVEEGRMYSRSAEHLQIAEENVERLKRITAAMERYIAYEKRAR